jgi:hypothetical protein
MWDLSWSAGCKAQHMIQIILTRPAGFLAALLAAAALACSSAARAENDHLIVPWQRIGPVTLGMTASDLVRILGEPTQKNRDLIVTLYYWKDDLTVTVKNDTATVTQICALSPDYATPQGLHPGLSETAVTALLGEAQNSRLYRGWWKLSYTNLSWGGLMVSIPLTGFTSDHSVSTVCVNHNA